MGFGAILILMGVGSYLATMKSFTALIPAVLGLIILVCGILAQNEAKRKHAMHSAAVVAVIGFFGSCMRGVPAVLSGKPLEHPIATAMQCATALLCVIFLALCIRSFKAARLARAANAP